MESLRLLFNKVQPTRENTAQMKAILNVMMEFAPSDAFAEVRFEKREQDDLIVADIEMHSVNGCFRSSANGKNICSVGQDATDQMMQNLKTWHAGCQSAS